MGSLILTLRGFGLISILVIVSVLDVRQNGVEARMMPMEEFEELGTDHYLRKKSMVGYGGQFAPVRKRRDAAYSASQSAEKREQFHDEIDAFAGRRLGSIPMWQRAGNNKQMRTMQEEFELSSFEK